MRHLRQLILTELSLLCLVTQLHAGEINVPSGQNPITLQDTDKYYYFPESSKTMPDTYHHMYIEGGHRVCYPAEDPEKDPDDRSLV